MQLSTTCSATFANLRQEIMVTKDLGDEMDWRERRRDSLRSSLLIAAEALIRKTRSTEFTMRALVDKAGTALATPYVLMGSKGAVLYALMNKGLESIDALIERSSSQDPIEDLLAVLAVSCDFYANDPVLYRPLMRFLIGAEEPEHHPILFNRAMQLMDPAIDRCIRSGVLLPNVRATSLKRLLMVNFMGALEFWIQEELDAHGFKNQVLYGMVLLLIPQVHEQAAVALQKRVRTLEDQQPSQLMMKPSGRIKKRSPIPPRKDLPKRTPFA
ncbi:MAG: TetR family transcriptional regulator [Panacagrimonas sp.]|jgi:AcrR family transcriptional regulator|nr:TetR/AcrR family transcriptional regulator [Panacagrimonas sp.]MCC2657563.1 TetR family transcriptional regulator [Panacagrimonas sp.]